MATAKKAKSSLKPKAEKKNGNKAPRKSTTPKVTKQGRLKQRPVASEMKQKDLDILTLSPSKAKEFLPGMTMPAIYTKKTNLFRAYGKDFLPQGAVKGERYTGPTLDNPKGIAGKTREQVTPQTADVVVEGKPGFRDVQSTSQKVQLVDTQVEGRDFSKVRNSFTGELTVKYGDTTLVFTEGTAPQNVRLNPASNTLKFS